MQHATSIETGQAGQARPIWDSSEHAFEDLFRQYQRPVYGWILRIVRDPAAAEDLTVETFWRIHRAWARYDRERAFEPWARRIATHAALDWLRARRPETPTADELLAATPAAGGGDPAVTAEIRHNVAQALGRLPPKLRIVAILTLIEECSQKEIAESLGITVSAVKLRAFRAVHRLRKDLQKQGIAP